MEDLDYYLWLALKHYLSDNFQAVLESTAYAKWARILIYSHIHGYHLDIPSLDKDLKKNPVIWYLTGGTFIYLKE